MKAKYLFFALLIASTSPAHADENVAQGTYFFDIVLYRPVGLLATVAGAGLFAAISPLTALAAISPPHDAFNIAADMLVVAPAKFTFERPLGVMNTDDDGRYRRH